MEREAVVRGDEVDRREGPPAVALVEIGGAGEPVGELPRGRLAAPEVAEQVAVQAVPLRPEDREVADLVAAVADVPRLGDQLHLGQDRVLVDDVEERRQAVDLVQLARQGRGEVEAEPVDMAFADEVAERVHDQPERAGMDRVEAVPGAGVVHVEPGRVGHESVVRRVVDAAEAEHRAQVIALGRVVVDDVEDHLDAGPVQRLHHPLELGELCAVRAGRRVEGVRGEVADRAVPPVVGEAPVDQVRLVGDMVNGEQLDGGDAERGQILERRSRREPGVGAAQVLADHLVQLREPLHVQLVDDRLVPRSRGRPVVFPVEPLVDDDALRHCVGVVLVVQVEVGVVLTRDVGQDVGVVVGDGAVDRLGVGIEQQLHRVEAQPALGLVRTVNAVAVPRAGADAGQVAVPVERRPLADPDPVSVPSSANRQSSTPSAVSEKSEKFVPSPSQLAPSGKGLPGQTSVTARPRP